MKTLDPILFNTRKEFLLKNARHLFATKGYAQTSMDDLAQACHIQKASLYHYFESKQKLMQELVDWGCGRWAERLKDYEASQTLEDTLRVVAGTILKDMDDPAQQEFHKIIHFESHNNPAIFKALKESPTHNRKGFFSVFARHLEGHPPKAIAAFITQFMGAILHYAMLTKLRTENLCFEAALSDEEYVDQLVKTFSAGIR